jgi:hypothetical protein
MEVTIFDWGTRPDFLLRRLYPDAHIVNAHPLTEHHVSAGANGGNCKERGLWIFHINVSYAENWCPDRTGLLERLGGSGYNVINGTIRDIRKTTLQRINAGLGLPHVKVSRDDDPAMRVIVKTDYNYGGMNESKLSDSELQKLGMTSNSWSPVSAFDEYYLCKLGDVCENTWEDKRLVVEKYISNRGNKICRFYRCGEHAILSEIENEDEIKKFLPGLPRKNWHIQLGEDDKYFEGTHHQAVHNAAALCRALMVKFAAIDIVLDQDERPYIIDLNLTPGWGMEKQDDILDYLRGGFERRL